MKKSLFISMLMFIVLTQAGFAQDTSGGAGDRRAALQSAVEARIQAMDTNGDGAIDRAEYLARAEAQFKKLDLNGDGRITPDERQKVRQRLGAARGGNAAFP